MTAAGGGMAASTKCQCEAEVLITAKFCKNCGRPNPAAQTLKGTEGRPAPPPPGPKRPVTSPQGAVPQDPRPSSSGSGTARPPMMPVKKSSAERRSKSTPQSKPLPKPRELPTLNNTAMMTAEFNGKPLSPKCSLCGTLYQPPMAKFCVHCGHQRGGTIMLPRKASTLAEEDLAATCTCGYTFPAGSTFCIGCGEKRKPKVPPASKPAAPPPAASPSPLPASPPPPSPPPASPTPPSPKPGKTREQLAAEAEQRHLSGGAAASDDEGDAPTAYMTVATSHFTSLDLLKSLFTKTESLENWTKGPILGRGSFGTVYQGLLTTGGFAAVKQINLSKPDCAAFTKELKLLHRELSVMRFLDHPNVCKFLGAEYDEKDEAINMFMEFVSGGSISSLIKKFKLLPVPVVRGYTADMFRGLAYLHDKGVIHRDIKGDNVLIDQEKGIVKLADFGASKKLAEQSSAARTMIGTPYWMAPEVITNPDGYNEKADIWSAGCTVVEMLTGKPPWPMKATPQAAMMMIAQGTKPTEIPSDIPEECASFLDECFQMDVVQRPRAAECLNHPWLATK
eukprot:TRINITY_DN1893_c0_g7_i1.p1 TRINITY_DN1893_c0_g7~~TRINITY_DN1893_c0_g7_i1.p1  ORF type:complete len:564 (+),score=194.73 TRINITY_DN1893_c0_g7_i1:90-1781(+)